MLDPQRFLDAQDPVLDAVRHELRAGRKRSHWMWFVFPQLRSLGRSPTALHYGLENLDDARAFLAHPTLGPRLVECAGLVATHPAKTPQEIFGSPDDLKFRSCITLFAVAAGPDDTIFTATLQQRFAGAGDPLTLAALA
ncbi:DUF1810 domain-containing protein [Roseomonas sp. 18066]|uniref:DUF1810 domain-containing protein n=1 Tax=Roseomonas sp. 18066 TaxID=2681412 RepID=UPI001359E91E|nr:DUF1810 domain-containing protein [Roseomonas sp. 18066]